MWLKQIIYCVEILNYLQSSGNLFSLIIPILVLPSTEFIIVKMRKQKELSGDLSPTYVKVNFERKKKLLK